ncbi:MAG: hypothetical protein AAFV69_06285 [Pseudomonadota bacterium]
MTARVSIKRGSVYIPADVYATYFKGIDAAALLVRDDHLHVLPVHHMAAGGALMKIRNAAGDRIVSAPDLFDNYGLEDWTAEHIEARWSADNAALIISLPQSPQLQT